MQIMCKILNKCFFSSCHIPEQGHQMSSVSDKCQNQQSWNEMELKLPKVEILSDSDSLQELPPEMPPSTLQNHEISTVYSHQEGRNSDYGPMSFNQNQYTNFSSFTNTLYPTAQEFNQINVPLDATFQNEEKVFNFPNLPNQEQMRRQGLFNNSHDLLTSENKIINGDTDDDEPLIWEPEMPAEHDYIDPQGQPIGTGLEAVLPGSDLYYEIVQTHENLTFPNASVNATQSRLQFLEKLKTKMQNKIAYYDKNKLTVKCSNNSDEKRVWDKQHFCMYCRRGSTNLAKHILHCHKNEEEVISILQCNLRSKQRVYLLDKLRFIGDYMHNMDVLKKEAGVIIAWRSPPDPVPVSNFVPCQHCLAFFQRKDLLRHDRTCKFRPRHRDNQINLKDLLSQSSLLLPVSYRIQRQMANEVLTVLPDDPLSQVVKNDDLILKFGSKLYQQVSHVPNCSEMVCESMRELSQLVIDIQSKDPSVDSLSDCISPERFSFVVSCVRGVCNKKKPGQVSGMVSEHMLRLGRMLSKCALILKSDAIINRQLDRRESAENFHWLCEIEWGQRSQSFLLN